MSHSIRSINLDNTYSGSQKSEDSRMPNAECPMPYALCPMPYALCRIVPHLSEKGYKYVIASTTK